MYALPTTITVDNTEYHIRNNGDYRVVLECFVALNDVELTETERTIAAILIFCDDLDLESLFQLTNDQVIEMTNQMYNFFNCGDSEGIAANTEHKVIDWEKDQQMICAGVNKVAGTEVRALEYLHWWTFMGYFCNIGESILSTVVSIREKIVKGKKLEKYEQEFRRNNPQYFVWDARTLQQKEDDELIKQIWDFGDGD